MDDLELIAKISEEAAVLRGVEGGTGVRRLYGVTTFMTGDGAVPEIATRGSPEA